MVRERTIEVTVGLFVLVGIIAFLMLAYKVSDFGGFKDRSKGYAITADFKNIGNLKVRAPVKVGGVSVGSVTGIVLDSNAYNAVVSLHIDSKDTKLPTSTSASINTAGLLGANYVGLNPDGAFADYDEEEGEEFLAENSHLGVTQTHSAMILEDLIGQLMFSVKKGKQ